jgi:hypothetical protein
MRFSLSGLSTPIFLKTLLISSGDLKVLSGFKTSVKGRLAAIGM